jgi:hypothetical protein
VLDVDDATTVTTWLAPSVLPPTGSGPPRCGAGAADDVRGTDGTRAGDDGTGCAGARSAEVRIGADDVVAPGLDERAVAVAVAVADAAGTPDVEGTPVCAPMA